MEMNLYPEKGDQGKSIKGTGLVHLCYGQGVGKTSRCVGLAVRAAGAGYKVHWVQFMKEGGSSETNSFALLPNISYQCPGKHPFISKSGPGPVHIEHARKALEMARDAVQAGCDVLILDEILNTLLFSILEPRHVLELISLCRGRCELVLSGADTPAEILEQADYATEFVMRKHPYNQGQDARKGIEF
ncbi:cob(I)yrinic acid a,c-diamide adenosyltransferase [Dethiosulfatarculus sandiegensis]|uniref:corrinoid adenosyltransferase n=1 Tax=Dethiosulfatarculus sandiegensis TaxID=1429043 RepID=A0A0D2I013_9BACT|nr:cob(I)yrinic acid a,c-diamide adenosyltransferase [Dethiosulfatarculus sandiegensis]KIX15883.1 cobinamide adenolsyltransferase [Dethiosulfatarculus sandiegensis]